MSAFFPLTFCERPVAWDQNGEQRLNDFWVQDRDQEILLVFGDDPLVPAKAVGNTSLRVRAIPLAALAAAGIWIANWERMLPCIIACLNSLTDTRLKAVARFVTEPLPLSRIERELGLGDPTLLRSVCRALVIGSDAVSQWKNVWKSVKILFTVRLLESEGEVMTAKTPSELRNVVRGEVVAPGDDGYDKARMVHNGMIDKRPAVIVRAANAGDVMLTVRYARENSLKLSVRGGGHSGPGFGTNDGGVVIDLSRMRGVRVDPLARTARAEGGATWGDFNAATHAFGLATTGGVISTTGIAGLTLGGGIGYLSRGLGLSLDNLLSADVVTADGRMLIVSETENADLFWAIRGGGGNFGVCTALEYKLHPVESVYWGPMFYEIEETENILKFYREYIKDAPEQMGAFPAFQIAPPLPFIPENRHGDMFAAIVACWSGDPAEGKRQFKAFHDVAEVKAEMVGPVPYPAINSAFDGLFPTGIRQYWKGNFVKELTDGAIAAHVQHGPKAPTVSSTMHLYPINGACHRVSPGSTAFGHRDANFAMVILAASHKPEDDEANTKWVRDYSNAVAPYSEVGGYVNFMDDDDIDRIRANYGGNYDRLVDIKRKYDPDNVFRINQNIAP